MAQSDAPDIAQTIGDLLLRVYEIHGHILARTGGIPGLRDAAMLHAAVARPFATFAGEELYPDDFEKAAALFHSLIKSHPFMDGTKRTAFAAALHFLSVYGHARPQFFPQEEVIQFCLVVAEENSPTAQSSSAPAKTVTEIASWFRGLFGA